MITGIPDEPEKEPEGADPFFDRLVRGAEEDANPGRKFRENWRSHARPEQIPPEGRWRVWYLAGGRGGGKTWTGAHTLAEWILSDPEPGEWGIIAPIYADAWSVCVEGESGFLAALGTNAEEVKRGKSELVEYWHRSFAEIKMRSGHIIRVASAEDGGLRIQGKNLKGAWCVAAGEPVTTARGDIPVENVRPGDLVWTRRGWKPVTASGLTRHGADVLALKTSDRHSIMVTSDHQVWTEEAGWLPASRVTPGMTLLTCPSQGRPHGSSGKASAGTSGLPARVAAKAITPIVRAACSTSPSGSALTASGSPRATSSTIATTTRPTTTRPTSLPSHARSICESTGFSAVPTLLRSAPTSASAPANPGRGGSLTPSSAMARDAARSSRPPASAPGSAHRYAAQRSTVLSVAPAGQADVYDLTVQDASEFFAGGILIHNCDEIGLWESWKTTWDESLRFAVRKGRSQIVATGTPKKSRKARELIRRLLGEPTVKKSRLRTLDNRANLSQAFLDEVVGAARGTRLEQQELEGVLLDDIEGALWTADGIDAYRTDREPELIRVVVAVDPAVSNEEDSDETGIVVVGEAEGGHGFVLADYSMRGTPDACMKKVVWAYRHHSADRVIGEANNGGDYIGALLATVDPNVPYEKVIASRGKRVRAEPVSALYEQGRVHHVGVHVMLEEQMVSWVPSDPGDSPDRVDALVWACSALRGLSSGSWLQAYGVKRCGDCGKAYPERKAECPSCHPETPGAPPPPGAGPATPPEPQAIGGWASAYGDFVRCPQCTRAYDKRRHQKCPACAGGGALAFLRQHGNPAGGRTGGLTSGFRR